VLKVDDIKSPGSQQCSSQSTLALLQRGTADMSQKSKTTHRSLMTERDVFIRRAVNTEHDAQHKIPTPV